MDMRKDNYKELNELSYKKEVWRTAANDWRREEDYANVMIYQDKNLPNLRMKIIS